MVTWVKPSYLQLCAAGFISSDWRGALLNSCKTFIPIT